MALINCSECKAEISDGAWFCPKCGHVLRYGLPALGQFAAGMSTIGQFTATRDGSGI